LARPRSLRLGAFALAAVLAFAPASRAMTVQLVPVPGEAPSAALLLQGHIVEGDARRLRRALAQGGFARWCSTARAAACSRRATWRG